jgi:predicted O-methyltransferase YrrM
MTMIKNIARAVLPEAARAKYRELMWKVKHRKPFRLFIPGTTPLSREILRLEFSKSKKPLEKLDGFAELDSSAWQGLQALAYQLVLRYRPKVIVELGTHMGLSALAMGLALKEIGEGGLLYAVDSWEGDPQAGHFGDEVYRKFLERREQLGLGSTIVPLKMYFDEAKDKVATPIDLLHIDGLHTWDAVSHDWETFGPLVRPGGLVLFHDVNTFYLEVAKFWSGLRKSWESHTVPYSHGLGILRKPEVRADQAAPSARA